MDTKVVANGERKKPPAAGMGRPKGTPNKTTALLKDAILMAAQNAGGGDDNGLAKYLEKQATINPGPFLSLLGKVLPMTVDANLKGNVTIRVSTGVPRAGD